MAKYFSSNLTFQIQTSFQRRNSVPKMSVRRTGIRCSDAMVTANDLPPDWPMMDCSLISPSALTLTLLFCQIIHRYIESNTCAPVSRQDHHHYHLHHQVCFWNSVRPACSAPVDCISLDQAQSDSTDVPPPPTIASPPVPTGRIQSMVELGFVYQTSMRKSLRWNRNESLSGAAWPD